MKTKFVKALLINAMLVCAVARLYGAEEQELISILQSDAGVPQKWAACQRLRLIGTEQSVPALSRLLPEERTSQAARHALEGLPFPAAGAALREALAKTTGTLKAGLVDSLGWRAEPESVAVLAPLVTDQDTAVAAAAARALGRIGGQAAITTLSAALGDAPSVRRPVLCEGLLGCAERLAGRPEGSQAAPLYRTVLDQAPSPQIRAAAWRGLVLSDAEHRDSLVMTALTGADGALRDAAFKVLRELQDPNLVRAAVRRWSSFSPEAQLALLDAQVKLGAEALPTVRAAGQSQDSAVRARAWAALGELNDVTSVPALAKAATSAEASESEMARESLMRLRGAGAREALLAHLQGAGTAEKAVILGVLGQRGDHGAVQVLLQHASTDAPPARQAALESLRTLAPPEAVGPLLDIAAKSGSDEERDPVLRALYAVCEASPDKARAARNIVASLERFPASERRQMLPLLSELATPEALEAAQKSAQDPNLELAKEAVRVLAQWPNAAPAEGLLDLARSSHDQTLQTLALRSAIQVTGQESDPTRRLALLRRALTTARTSDEKKQALGQVGQVPSRDALDLALGYLKEGELAEEASVAAVTVAEKLALSDPKLADDVAARLLEQVKEGDVARRAWALRLKPSSAASFIRDWMVSGPYRQAGIVGAEAVFNLSFAPEQTGETLEWKAVPPADQVNLAALFPGAENCAAYLRTRVLAPQDGTGALLLGSDDGIKAWLNGKVVHSHNVDRGQAVDQDAAPIQLKKGPNELMLKVSQGGGGWSACARIVGPDGKPIPGLMVERPLAGR